MGVRGYHQLVCVGLSESAAKRRVFFTCGGGAPTSCDRRRQRTENIVTSLRSVPNEGGRQEEVFSILVVFFAVGTISGKSLKLLPAGVIFTATMHHIRFRPLGELTALPRPFSCI